MKHELLLMRHGQTEWNRAQRMQGRMNSPLTDLGRSQAAQLAAILAPLDLSGWQLLCSPQGRALATAGIALGAQMAPIRTDDRLMEIDVGDWSGKTRDELRALRPDLFSDDPAGRLAWYDAAPGGEGFAGLQRRCAALLADLTGPAVIVAHGITLRMLRCLALYGDTARFGEGEFGRQGVIYRIHAGQIEEISAPGQISS